MGSEEMHQARIKSETKEQQAAVNKKMGIGNAREDHRFAPKYARTIGRPSMRLFLRRSLAGQAQGFLQCAQGRPADELLERLGTRLFVMRSRSERGCKRL
jgi:hypothetical protein